MFSKMKLWLMTDENKEKYLLEQEKKERESKRNVPEESVKPVKVKKQKPKKSNGKKDNDLPEESLNPVDNEEPKKKIIKKVVKKKVLTEQDEELAKFEAENSNVKNKADEDLSLDDSEIDVSGIDDILKEREEYEEKERVQKETIEETVELIEVPENEENNYLKGIHAESEKLKRLELVKKKQEEKGKWMGVMIDLPPTSDPDLRIQYALKEGVPEWYLREEGYIVNDEIKEEEMFSFSSDLSGEVGDISLDDLEEESKKEDIKEEIVVETKENVVVETEEEIVVETKEEIVSEIEEIVSEIEEIVSEIEEDVKDDKVSEIEEEIKEDIVSEIEDIEEDLSSDEVKTESKDKTEMLSGLKERLKQLNMAKEKPVDVPEEVVEETVEKQPTNLEERLAKLKMRREVINKDGNKLLVKEVLDIDGETKSQYKSYNVSEEEGSKVNVGEIIDDDVILEHIEDETIIIDGEHYDLSEEEEIELLNKYGIREIWLLTTDTDMFEKAVNNLRGSRYIPKMIQTDRDFLLSTRSVNNVILFTMMIPNEVKKSVSGFLKYLQKEDKRARLITSEESKVNSKIIEHVISDITVEELDFYFDEFDYSLYSEIKKSLVDLYRVISFDLTDSFDDNLMIDLEIIEGARKDRGDKEIELLNPIPIELKTENPLEKRSGGDKEINFSDTILINDSKDMFKRKKNK